MRIRPQLAIEYGWRVIDAISVYARASNWCFQRTRMTVAVLKMRALIWQQLNVAIRMPLSYMRERSTRTASTVNNNSYASTTTATDEYVSISSRSTHRRPPIKFTWMKFTSALNCCSEKEIPNYDATMNATNHNVDGACDEINSATISFDLNICFAFGSNFSHCVASNARKLLSISASWKCIFTHAHTHTHGPMRLHCAVQLDAIAFRCNVSQLLLQVAHALNASR